MDVGVIAIILYCTLVFPVILNTQNKTEFSFVMSLVCLFPFTISFSLSLSLLNFTLFSTKNSPPHLFMLFKISFKALHGRSLYIGLAEQLYICTLLLDGACGMPYEVYIFMHLHIVFNKIITTKKLQIYNPFELLHQCLILSYHKENIYQT